MAFNADLLGIALFFVYRTIYTHPGGRYEAVWRTEAVIKSWQSATPSWVKNTATK